jgi:hypothetical protein
VIEYEYECEYEYEAEGLGGQGERGAGVNRRPSRGSESGDPARRVPLCLRASVSGSILVEAPKSAPEGSWVSSSYSYSYSYAYSYSTA